MRRIVHFLVPVLLAAPAFADTAFTFNGVAPSTGFSETDSVTFSINPINGALDIKLNNNTLNMTADKQILTAVAFTFANAPTSLTGINLINPLVNTYNENDTNGSLTQVGANVSANWALSTSTVSNYITLSNLLGGNGGGAMGVISTSLSSTTTNLTKHDPYIESGNTWEITGLGLTSTSQITSVEFNWGTALNTFSAPFTSTPEPTTFGFASMGIAALLLTALKRK